MAVIFLVLEQLKGDTAIKWKDIPLPAGRSVIACQRMFERVTAEVKDDLEKIKTGEPLQLDQPATPKRARKRKVDAATPTGGDGEEDAKPAKSPRTPRKGKGKGKVKTDEVGQGVKDEPEDEE